MNYSFRLADHDGVLCVVWRSTDHFTPKQVDNYYPTIADTRSFCRYYEIDPARLAEFTVEQSGAGEYRISHAELLGRGLGSILALKEYGRTLPIHTEVLSVAPPKTKQPVEWRNGQWWKQTARGWKAA
jgi:hypothetical protein